MDWLPGVDLTEAEHAFVEMVGIGATVLAASLAAGAIWQAGRHGRKALDAIRRERRLDFELDLLKELAEFVSQSYNVAGRNRQCRLRLSLLPPTGLTQCRTRFRLEGAEAYDRLVNDTLVAPLRDLDESDMRDGGTLRETMHVEVQEAIRTRLDERGG